MQYGKSVDRYFSARERLEQTQFAGLEGLEPRLLLSATPKIRIKNATALEGDAGQFNKMIFEVARKGDTSGVTRVNFTTGLSGAINAALQGADFLGRQGVVKFKAGQKRKTVTVTIVGNNTQQPDRSFVVNLTGAKNGQIKRKTGFGIINDDDGAGPQSQTPTVRINDVSQNEGNAGTTAFTFNVTLSNSHDKTVTVDFQTSNGTAKAADNDYQPTNGTLTFLPGETSKNVTVLVNGDTKAELDETFIVNLSKATNAIIVDAAGVGNILNDDGAPSLRIDDVSVVEGSNGQTTKAVFTVSLNGQLDEELTVDYATSGGTATADVDFVSQTGTLTFAPGETSKTIEIDIIGDNSVEPDEDFFVNLSNPSLPADKVVLTDNQGKGTIVNDDAAPVVTINNVSLNEGNAGATQFIFTVNLNTPATETATVDFQVVDGTATAGDDDYTPLAGTLTFAPGEITKTIIVNVTGDTKLEANETFFVNLSNPQKLTIGDNQGQGTIVNDDLPPQVSIADASITEGDAGQKLLTFNLTLSQAAGLPVSVNYATANSTATAGSDYVASSGTVNFPAGTTTQTITVPIIGDTTPEASEVFFVNLSSPVNATIGDGQAIGTITDDDAVRSLSINDVTITEGDAGQKFAIFTVTLSGTGTTPVSVNFATANGTATAGSDYTAASGTLTFSPGQTTQQVFVPIIGDTTPEANETFFVNLSNATGGATIVDSQGIGTITDDDSTRTLAINDVAITEGDAGTKLLTFTVTLTGTGATPVTVNYATANGTATAGSDYVAANGTLTFNAGETSKVIQVTINGDTTPEASETFFVNLSNATGASIVDAQGIGTITDDDGTPSLTINDVTVTEGDAGTTNMVFTVTLAGEINQPVSVNYATAPGTATAGVDYTSVNGTLNFTVGGPNTQTIIVPIIGDLVTEGNETLTVNLSNATNAVITDAQGIGTITDNDVKPDVNVSDAVGFSGSVVTDNDEENGGLKAFRFTITLSAPSNQPITVTYETADIDATGGAAAGPGIDYISKSGSVTFAPGETTKFVDVFVVGDTDIEPDEKFVLNLLAVTQGEADIQDSQGVANILDDDAPPAP